MGIFLDKDELARTQGAENTAFRTPVRGGGRAGRGGAGARRGSHRRPLLEPYEADLKQLVEASPDITLAELQAALRRRSGVGAGLTTLHNTLRRLGLRHKKSP